MKKMLWGIVALVVVIAGVVFVTFRYSNSAAEKAGYYTLRRIDTSCGIYDENKNFLADKGTYYDKNGGLVTGVFKMFYPFGRVMFTAELAAGKYDGEMRYYSFGGELRSVNRYKNGKLDGAVVLFEADGSKKAEIPYKDGVEDGVFKTYYPDGTLKGEGIIDKGERTENFRLYHPDGTEAACGGSLCENEAADER